MTKQFTTQTTLSTLNSLIVKLIDEKWLKDRNEHLALMGKPKEKNKDKKNKVRKDNKRQTDKKKNAGKGKGKDGKCTYCEKKTHAEENC